jgi:hypothetical protein
VCPLGLGRDVIGPGVRNDYALPVDPATQPATTPNSSYGAIGGAVAKVRGSVLWCRRGSDQALTETIRALTRSALPLISSSMASPSETAARSATSLLMTI